MIQTSNDNKYDITEFSDGHKDTVKKRSFSKLGRN